MLSNLVGTLMEQAQRADARAAAIGQQLRSVQGQLRRSHAQRPGSTGLNGTIPFAESFPVR